MAFDAASRDDSRSEKDSLVALVSSRLISLTQTIAVLEKLVPQVGSAADGAALRQRLAIAETKADSLNGEIETSSRRLRVDSAGSASGAAGAPRSAAEQVLQQYAEARRRLLDVLRASQARQQQFPPPEAGAAAAGSPASPGPRGRRENGQDAIELSAIRPLDDVDEAIMAERRREAESIAIEAIEVRNTMRDLSGLVAAQGEALNKVEANVETTRDTVIVANKDLTLAASYQGNYRRRCFCFAALFIILLGVIVLLVLHFAVKPPII